MSLRFALCVLLDFFVVVVNYVPHVWHAASYLALVLSIFLSNHLSVNDVEN